MMSSVPIGSVVIPAHNEAAVIRQCLDALLADFRADELKVVVACNGCDDDTADIVRTSWPSVRVIELAEASKAASLRAADEVLDVFPRIYLDADVILPAASARLMIEYLRTDSALAARPPAVYETSHSDALVRSYYRARARVVASMHSLWGAGVYALSAAGRARFDVYPDLIADDLFAAQWFKSSEVAIVGSAPAVTTVPRQTRDLFRVLRRRYQGNRDIRALPGGPASTASSVLRFLGAAAISDFGAAVDTAMDTATFVGMAAGVRISRAVAPPVGWARDESSRAAMGGAEAG